MPKIKDCGAEPCTPRELAIYACSADRPNGPSKHWFDPRCALDIHDFRTYSHGFMGFTRSGKHARVSPGGWVEICARCGVKRRLGVALA